MMVGGFAFLAVRTCSLAFVILAAGGIQSPGCRRTWLGNGRHGRASPRRVVRRLNRVGGWEGLWIPVATGMTGGWGYGFTAGGAEGAEFFSKGLGVRWPCNYCHMISSAMVIGKQIMLC